MDHDNSNKLLFSQATMVEDLLQGFVREAWVARVDFTTLVKVSGSYVSDDLRNREDDIYQDLIRTQQSCVLRNVKYSCLPMLAGVARLTQIIGIKSVSLSVRQRRVTA